MKRIHNFGAGPGQLPLSVIETLNKSLLSYRETGIGVAELSHRSKEFEEIVSRTKAKFTALLSIPDTYEVIFCTGGATQQFSMLPMNFLKEGKVGAYLVTGIWGKKAEEEARKFGKTAIVKDGELPANAAYLHFTSNDTIEGQQFHKEPESGTIPLVCDASSDIASRSIDISRYSLIYAGAQKNLGIAGVTVVIIKRSLFDEAEHGIPNSNNIPVLLDYRTYIKNNSLYNTPPTAAIYTCELVLDWIDSQGGLEKIAEINTKKSQMLYDVIDGSEFYKTTVARSARSKMNITFTLANKDREIAFINNAKKLGIEGIKGHSTVGGIRVSLYNAVTLDSVSVLCEYMRNFARL